MVGVETDRGSIDTPVVIDAAGPWAARVARLAGVELPIGVARTQLAAFRVPADFGHPLPILGDGVQLCYFQPELGGLVMVGPRGPSGISTRVDPDRFDEGLDPDRGLVAAEALCRRFPAMERAYPAGGYASLYDVTPDSHFVLEANPVVSGLFIAAGFNGHGFKHAPVIGAIMAELVCDGRTTEFDIRPFSSLRFAGRRPHWRGLYARIPF